MMEYVRQEKIEYVRQKKIEPPALSEEEMDEELERSQKLLKEK